MAPALSTPAERVLETMIEAVCDGSLRSGARFAPEDLARRLPSATDALADAIARLEREGFVSRDRDQALRVAPLDADFVHSLFELRGALDGIAAREAALRMGAKATDRATATIIAGRAAIASDSAARMAAADFGFHGLLHQLSGNLLVTQTMALHWPQIRWLIGHASTMRSRWSQAWREHEAILAAITAGDAESAEFLAREHIRIAADALIATLGQQSDSPHARSN